MSQLQEVWRNFAESGHFFKWVWPQFFISIWHPWDKVWLRGGTGSGVPETTTARFCIFHSDPDPDPQSKICEKPDSEPESLFNFGSSRSLCGHFLSTLENMGKLRLDR